MQMSDRSSLKNDVAILTHWSNKRYKNNSKTVLTKILLNTINSTQPLVRASSQLINHIAPSRFTIKMNPQNFKYIYFRSGVPTIEATEAAASAKIEVN